MSSTKSRIGLIERFYQLEIDMDIQTTKPRSSTEYNIIGTGSVKKSDLSISRETV